MCVEVKDELQAKEVTRHSGHRSTKKMSARGNYQQLKLETRVNMKSPSAERARSREQRDITLTYYSNISETNVYLTSISFRSASRGEKKKIITLCPWRLEKPTHKKTYRIIIVAVFFSPRRRQHRDEPGRRTERASHVSQKFNTQGCEIEAKKRNKSCTSTISVTKCWANVISSVKRLPLGVPSTIISTKLSNRCCGTAKRPITDCQRHASHSAFVEKKPNLI